MVMFADFTRNERTSYFSDHGEALLQSRAEARAALEKFAATLKACGAHERPGFTVEGAVAKWFEAIDNDLPEEVVDYFGAV